MYLSLKKYLSFSLKWLLPFLLLETVICLVYFTDVIGSAVFTVLSLVSVICLFIPGTYYLVLFFVFKKKCKALPLKEGVISNWQAGFFRYTGSVIVIEGAAEYQTSAYFHQDEAKELVGKPCSYALADGTLLICDIKDHI